MFASEKASYFECEWDSLDYSTLHDLVIIDYGVWLSKRVVISHGIFHSYCRPLSSICVDELLGGVSDPSLFGAAFVATWSRCFPCCCRLVVTLYQTPRQSSNIGWKA